jgi:1-phosphatidylinositol-3-phosphate 5-kinase
MTALSSLFSFAKFLELLFYSSIICTLSRKLCTHTSPSTPSTPLPASRFNIIRHFAYKSHRVSFILSPADDIFDLRVPRLQFTKGGWVVEKPSSAATWSSMVDDVDKKELRQEIKYWWQAVAEHLDKLVCHFRIRNISAFLNRLAGGRVCKLFYLLS